MNSLFYTARDRGEKKRRWTEDGGAELNPMGALPFVSFVEMKQLPKEHKVIFPEILEQG